MAEQEQNRSEEATPYKLKEAQKRGQTAKSQEATFVAILAAAVLALFAAAPSSARRLLGLTQSILLQAGRTEWTSDAVAGWLTSLLSTCLSELAPLLLAVLAAAILANLAQVGPVFSAHPVKPDLQRINPAAGFKRLLSLRLLYEACKSVLKLLMLSLVLALALRALLPLLVRLAYLDARYHAALVMPEVAPLVTRLLLALLAIVLIDLIYTRRSFAKQMRMSRREITDEHKQRDGDPRIRARIRQLRMDFLKKSRAVRNLPDADVLLTNPTHYAVALSYKHGSMPAPKVLAKGAGQLAAKMRETARRLHIPVVENPPLARALYKRMDADQYLPEDLYPQVAKILLWVYAMRDTSATRSV